MSKKKRLAVKLQPLGFVRPDFKIIIVIQINYFGLIYLYY